MNTQWRKIREATHGDAAMPWIFLEETFFSEKKLSWRHIRAKGATAKLSCDKVIEGKAGQHAGKLQSLSKRS